MSQKQKFKKVVTYRDNVDGMTENEVLFMVFFNLFGGLLLNAFLFSYFENGLGLFGSGFVSVLVIMLLNIPLFFLLTRDVHWESKK